MIDILNKYKDRLQKELAEQCVNDTESILHDLDWWGGLDLPEGYAFDFNVYEVDDALKAIAYICDERDDLGHPRSSFQYSIELDVLQFLIDQYQLRKSTGAKKFKVRIFYNMFEDIEVEADSYEDARTQAFDLGGTGKTQTTYDFMEIEEVTS